MKLTFKPGVSIRGIQPEMALSACLIASVFAEFNNAECVITSATDGKHGPHSHHYKGFALDFRTRHVPEGWHARLHKRLQDALGPEFQVVLHKTHIHVEYDPE